MVGDLQGVAWFYSSGFEVNSFARALLPFRRCLATLLPALPSSFSGKYVVSIMVPLSVVSVTVPGGCRSQGCHGYPTRSAPVLEAPPSFQAPSPSSSIVDEFNNFARANKKVSSANCLIFYTSVVSFLGLKTASIYKRSFTCYCHLFGNVKQVAKR